MKSHWACIFLSGVCTGVILLLTLIVLLVLQVPAWLVVTEQPQTADVIVVLGGGGPSRLRKGLALYDAGLAKQLLLVDSSRNDWTALIQEVCPNCTDKKITILEGSRDTFTDAELTKKYCLAQKIRSLLVVTDPYHTRRVALIFRKEFSSSSVGVKVISSGEFKPLLSPNQRWWQDNATLKTIWTEANKNFLILLRNYGLFAD
ncbi:YdcF family protein [Candidatus Electronema sp. PJ]|uniref:YdcF family protein n=1 Tax=Candidatus Electronema sp. PJ TaxID=3401572 RepID=UPI003AA85705